MKKMVLKLDLQDDKGKQKAMKIVSGLSGVEAIAMDVKDKKLTVTGDLDPVTLVSKLRKICSTEIITVGPKEPEKKKEEAKKEEPKKGDENKKDPKDEVLKPYQMTYYPPHLPIQAYNQPPSYIQQPNFYRGAEEDPNSCVIC